MNNEDKFWAQLKDWDRLCFHLQEKGHGQPVTGNDPRVVTASYVYYVNTDYAPTLAARVESEELDAYFSHVQKMGDHHGKSLCIGTGLANPNPDDPGTTLEAAINYIVSTGTACFVHEKYASMAGNWLVLVYQTQNGNMPLVRVAYCGLNHDGFMTEQYLKQWVKDVIRYDTGPSGGNIGRQIRQWGGLRILPDCLIGNV